MTPVQLPVQVREGTEGLLLVWYDTAGSPQTVTSPAAVPEGQRAQVRVDFLRPDPALRPVEGQVFVTDLRNADAEGNYPVRSMPRAALDQLISGNAAAARPAAPATATAATTGGGEGVVLYGTSWCGACRSARRYFESKGIAFEDKDIEKDPAARADMQRKVRAAGLRGGSVPVIDVRGTVMSGFDAKRVAALLAAPSAPTVPPAPNTPGSI